MFETDGPLDTGAFEVTLVDTGNTTLGDVNIPAGGNLVVDTAALTTGDLLSGEGTVTGDVRLGAGEIDGPLTVTGDVDGAAGTGNANIQVGSGGDPGILDIGGALELEGGDALTIRIDGTAGAGTTGGHDQVQTTSTALTLNGASALPSLNLVSAGPLSFTLGTVIPVVTGSVTGTFAGMPEGSVLSLGTQPVSYTHLTLPTIYSV